MIRNIEKRIVVLLPCPLYKDSRAQRTVRSMSKGYLVDVFFISSGESDKSHQIQFNDNVNIIPVEPPERNLWQKVLIHSFFYLELRKLISTVKKYDVMSYDLIYAHDLPTLYPAIKLKRIYNCQLLYDAHDLYVETINQFFPSKSPIYKRIIFSFLIFLMRFLGQAYERKALKFCDVFITPSNSYLTYFKNQYGVQLGYVVPNYPEYQDYPKNKVLRKKLGISDEVFISLYQGALSEGRYLREIIYSAKFIEKNILIVIIGNGQLKPELQEFCTKNNLEKKVVFLDHIPYSELFKYTADANIGIMINEHINLSKKYAFANKVTEYMACKIPVLLSDSPEYNRVQNIKKIGITLKNVTAKKIAEALNAAYKARNDLKKMGENGQSLYQESLNWHKHEPEFYQLINKTLNQ